MFLLRVYWDVFSILSLCSLFTFIAPSFSLLVPNAPFQFVILLHNFSFATSSIPFHAPFYDFPAPFSRITICLLPTNFLWLALCSFMKNMACSLPLGYPSQGLITLNWVPILIFPEKTRMSYHFISEDEICDNDDDHYKHCESDSHTNHHWSYLLTGCGHLICYNTIQYRSIQYNTIQYNVQ